MATALILLRHLIWALVWVLALSKEPDVSKEEYLEMKRYLRFINRPPVKSIKTKYGGIFYCVDIYKQPALDHPLLQNHTIQMRPSSLPKRVDSAPVTSKTSESFGVPHDGCPPQTVLIRRIRMGDLLRAGSVSKFLSKGARTEAPHKYAIMRVFNGKFYGTEASFNLWNPQVAHSQFSLTQLWIINGPYGNWNRLEAGWVVHPTRYNDTRTHLFIFTYGSPSDSYSCWDLDCPGFVQVSNEITPGSVLEPVSTVDGLQYELNLTVFKDHETGHWWLIHGTNHSIGYWPSSIVPKLEYANRVDWGGETTRGNEGIYPPMGSGNYANQGHRKTSYVKDIKLVDAEGQRIDVPTDANISETPGCYTLDDRGNAQNESGRRFYYGGC